MIATATRTMAATGALHFLAGGVVALPRRVCVYGVRMLSHLCWFALDAWSPAPAWLVPSHAPMMGMPWRPQAGSRGLRLVFHVGQYPDHEGQQLLQRVEACHLTGDEMLDPAIIA